MIKIRVWHKNKLYMDVEHVSHNDGRTSIRLLGEKAIYFSPAPDQPFTMMLWTGLKDNMNQDIWEGDVLEFYFKGKTERCEVIFTGGLFCLKWKDGYINKYPLNPSNYNVIGNVYEMTGWRTY